MPETREAAAARRLRWKHNSFFGHAVMSKQHMKSIIRSETATDETKQLAHEIYGQLDHLITSLKTRKDQL